MGEFRPGVEVCREFYTTAVRPVLDPAFPGLRYAAARIGPGSDVLGYDTPRSMDHDWGPQLQLFLTPADLAVHAEAISAVLAERLPVSVLGHSTHFLPIGARVRSMAPTTAGPVAHRVTVTSVPAFTLAQLGVADVAELSWLAVPGQRLAETVGGAVYRDDDGDLTALRAALAWYPGDVWRPVLAAEWAHLAQEEAFPGRALEAGDDLGSLVVAARLTRHVMRLALLLRRRYPPYGKWLGTAFAALGFPADLTGIADPARRLDVLCQAYETLARWQNDLGVTPPLDPGRRPYFDRPYDVIDAGRFATALWPSGVPVGAVDQYIDSTDLLTSPADCLRLARPGNPAAIPSG